MVAHKIQKDLFSYLPSTTDYHQEENIRLLQHLFQQRINCQHEILFKYKSTKITTLPRIFENESNRYNR